MLLLFGFARWRRARERLRWILLSRCLIGLWQRIERSLVRAMGVEVVRDNANDSGEGNADGYRDRRKRSTGCLGHRWMNLPQRRHVCVRRYFSTTHMLR